MKKQFKNCRILYVVFVLAYLSSCSNSEEVTIMEDEVLKEQNTNNLNQRFINGKKVVFEVHRDKDSSDDDLYYRIGEVNSNSSITWKKASFYTNGDTPTVGMNDNYVFEIHGDDKLYYRIGRFDDNYNLTWDKISYTTRGDDPSVDLNNRNRVVEVHEGRKELFYRTGTINNPSNFEWDHIADFVSGIQPDVAINEDNIVVAVHRDEYQAFSTSLYIGVGRLLSNGVIDWKYKENKYDNGEGFPSIAIDGNKIVEIHEGFNEQLIIRVGQLNPDLSITWFSKKFYTKGLRPSVSLRGNKVLESHWGAGDKLYYRIGEIQSDNTVKWNYISFYTTGRKPSITF